MGLLCLLCRFDSNRLDNSLTTNRYHYTSSIFLGCLCLPCLPVILSPPIFISWNPVQCLQPEETILLYFPYLPHFIYATQLRQQIFLEHLLSWVSCQILLADYQEKRHSLVLSSWNIQPKISWSIKYFFYF